MKRVLLLLILFLSACGGADDPTYGYGWGYDEISETTGIMVKWDKNTRYDLDLNTLDRWYLETQKCVNIKGGGVLVIFVNDIIRDRYYGLSNNSGVILIWNQNDGLSSNNGWMLKHEFIHTLTGDFSDNHSSPYFDVCEYYP